MKMQVKYCMSFTQEFFKQVKERAAEKQMTVACFIRQALIAYMKKGE